MHDNDLGKCATPSGDNENYKENAALLLQSFVRGSLCRSRISDVVQSLIDEILANRVGREHGPEVPISTSVPSEVEIAAHKGEENKLTPAGMLDSVEWGEDQAVFEALESVGATETDVKVGIFLDASEANTDDPHTTGVIEADQHEAGDVVDEDGKAQEDLKEDTIEPSPTYVGLEDQLKDVERAKEDRLPSWWMKYVLYKFLPADEVVEDGVVTTSTDFNAARSMFR